MTSTTVNLNAYDVNPLAPLAVSRCTSQSLDPCCPLVPCHRTPQPPRTATPICPQIRALQHLTLLQNQQREAKGIATSCSGYNTVTYRVS